MRVALGVFLCVFAGQYARPYWAAGAASAAEMAPFVIPATPNEASLVALRSPPIAADGPRLVAADGHFMLGEKRVRIWGVNLCFGANFPAHADAARVAARLAAAGVNSVRLHHMDTSAYPRGILEPKNPLKLSAEAVERLDYFVDQLARRGIWVNVNLHVGRAPSKALGLPEPNTKYDKIVGIFTPALIDAQKQYARDVLAHVNPYRKVRYADDPAIAFVEVTNEDSLFMWSARQDLQNLPEFYATLLRQKYNAWLKARYGTSESLRAAWAKGAEPLGANLLADPKFEKVDAADVKGPRWQMEQHAGNAAKLVHPADNPAAARLEIAQADATSWHLQFKQSPLAIEAGRYYTLTFRARADQARGISCGVGQAHDPWGSLGLSASQKLSPEWQSFRSGFVATASDDDARLSFSVGGSTAAVDLADIVLAPGGREGLGKDESIKAQNVALFAPGEVEARAMDRVRFLMDTEKAYFDGLYSFIKKDLGAKALVTGTIVFGPCGLYGQSGMDYIDGHAYWQHPSFPGRPWDPNNWTVNQVAMVDKPAQATLPRLAAERMEGKPFTLSEYNHPAPNDFQAECVPLVAAWAAAQDWDGVWLFTYSHRTGDADAEAYSGFFDIDMNPAKWGFMQAGAAIFREGALPPHRRAFSLCIAAEEEPLASLAAHYLKRDRDMLAVVSDKMPTTWQDLLGVRLEVALAGHSGATDSGAQVQPQMAWTVDEKGQGRFAAAGPGAAVYVGRAGGTTGLESLPIELAKPDFAAVTVTALDGRPLARSAAILVAACGKCENTDMKFSSDRRTVGTAWGKPPVRIEPVEGRVTLPPGEWKCRALAPDGTPAADVPISKGQAGASVLRLSPEYKTMWYLVTPAEKK
ncbi:MAG: carbohydrate binding domain-containing protein [Planctomycetes bacterium]|nr:carbohydrate binding domain-containing protein [Planctomycetota bacterium]